MNKSLTTSNRFLARSDMHCQATRVSPPPSTERKKRGRGEVRGRGMNDAELMSALIVGVVIGFYLMFWRPDQKARDKHKKQMRDLRAGDEVLTTSNFVATIRDIQVPESGQPRITLELADGVLVTALPGAILERLSAGRNDIAAEKQPSEQKGRS
ncbi:MAG: preprotein translocase subunit YajC [Dehalococcoidia bacterium]|nr:preprotein translocase subunit YajC [Dehalococcoidia bacterium]